MYQNAQGVRAGVFLTESHDATWKLPVHAHWVHKEELQELVFVDEQHKVAIQQAFSYSTSLPWRQRGWFAKTAQRMQEQLVALHYVPVGPIEQVRSWFLSCILRVPTTTGYVYCKAAPPAYAYEPALTQMLAAHYPLLAPPVLAIDCERDVLLMQGIDGVKLRHLGKANYLPYWEALLHSFAQMQLDYAVHIDDVLATGCPDWRLDKLEQAIDPFFAQLPGLLQQIPHHFSENELALLYSLPIRLKQMCIELSDYNLPASLHHGDFHSGNILANEQQCVLIDWASFIAVTHPFFCLLVVFEEHSDPQIRAHLRDLYLSHWTGYMPLEHLRSAFDLALPLSALHSVLCSSMQLADAETSWEREQEQGNVLEVLQNLMVLMT
jgi:hypothetical protein